MNPERGSCKLFYRPNLVYTSINIRKKNKLIAHIYIGFNQTFDDKSYVSAEKHVHAIFLLTRTAPTSSQIVESDGLF